MSMIALEKFAGVSVRKIMDAAKNLKNTEPGRATMLANWAGRKSAGHLAAGVKPYSGEASKVLQRVGKGFKKNPTYTPTSRDMTHLAGGDKAMSVLRNSAPRETLMKVHMNVAKKRGGVAIN